MDSRDAFSCFLFPSLLRQEIICYPLDSSQAYQEYEGSYLRVQS